MHAMQGAERERKRTEIEREREKKKQPTTNRTPPPPPQKKKQRATVAQKHTALTRKIAHPVPLGHCNANRARRELDRMTGANRSRSTAPPGLTRPGAGATIRGCAHRRNGHSPFSSL